MPIDFKILQIKEEDINKIPPLTLEYINEVVNEYTL